jgi:beta-N-acetylhexosaminidase
VRSSRSWIGKTGAVATVVLLAGCTAAGGAHSSGAGSPHRGAAAGAVAPGSAAARGAGQRAAALASDPGQPAVALPTLTDRQLAGQRVIYSYSGLTPPAGLLRRIRHGQAAGVIFFSPNIASRAQLRRVAAELQRADRSTLNPVRKPLLLMTDQEGGLVRRLPGTPAKSEKQIGESASPQSAARNAGQGAGRSLHGAGLNVNLAPVLDVYRRAGNFIDKFGRSYSKNPAVVAKLGADFIKAQQHQGVAATAKHFPGLGAAAASQNTDLGPVTLNLSSHDIRTIDEFPYTAAIAAGVKLVMVSWASYPSLGSRRPAGLSSKVVQGELRRRLGFTGVTITDALEAGALEHYGSFGNRAVLAATAGMDLLLCSVQHVSEGTEALAGLVNAYRDGTLNRSKFRASVQKVIALRASLPG